MQEVLKATVCELQALLRKRELSSVELTQAYLEAIRKQDENIRAYLLVDEDLALSQAKAADTLLAEGKGQELTGIPVAVKDNICTQGVATTCASRILEGFVPPYDAAVIERLQAQGYVLLGKTNLDEFAMGSSTENSGFFPTRNPWNLERVPGGSSGGSAAAVAGGLAPVALGSDTGGSIRQPAACCGVVGVKPTYGLVSRYGLVAFASSFDQIGPLARDVRDAALMLRVIAGHDRRDSTSLPNAVKDYPAALGQEVKKVRVAVPREYFGEGLDAEVEACIRRAQQVLEGLGVEFVEVSLPHMEYAVATYYVVATAEASSNLARYDGVRYGFRSPHYTNLEEMYETTRSLGFGAEVKRRIMLGTYALSSGYYDAYYLKAQKVRALIRQDFKRVFENCDLVLTPTSPTPAFRLGEKTADPLQMYLSDIYTISANLAGIPAISVPCGKSSEGLPVGLQFMGPPLAEDKILQVAYAYEQASGCCWKSLVEAGEILSFSTASKE